MVVARLLSETIELGCLDFVERQSRIGLLSCFEVAEFLKTSRAHVEVLAERRKRKREKTSRGRFFTKRKSKTRRRSVDGRGEKAAKVERVGWLNCAVRIVNPNATTDGWWLPVRYYEGWSGNRSTESRRDEWKALSFELR